MKAGIPFTTSLENHYLGDRIKRQVLLCHPLLFHIARLDEQGLDLSQWFGNLADSQIEIEDVGSFTKTELAYYYKKFQFLKEHGYFNTINYNEHFTTQLPPETVQHTLANVKHVVFEVTDACNLRCEYCGYGKYYCNYDKRQGRRLDVDVAKQLLTYLQQLWNSNSNLSYDGRITVGFYGGEPLLNFSFIRDIVNFVQNLDVPRQHFTFALTTNAVLLEKYMDFLENHEFHVLISLDGNRKNNSYRVFPDGVEAYDHIIKNVEALRKRYPDYFTKYVNFNTVFHNRNTLEEIYHYFSSKFDKVPLIYELNTSGIVPEKKKDFWNLFSSIIDDFSRIKKPQSLIDGMFDKLPIVDGVAKFIHRYTDSSFFGYHDLLTADSTLPQLATGTCIPFLRKIFVTVNNKIFPCERVGHQFSLGHVATKEVEIDFQQIAKKYESYFKKITKLCRNCYSSDNCIQCVFHTDIEKIHPNCKNFQTYDDCKKYFAANMSSIEHQPGLYHKIIEEVSYE